MRSNRAASGSGARGTLDYDHAMFEKLRALRRSIASAEGVPPYVVFGDATLQQMAHFFPQNLNSLSQMSGVGAVKLKRYGDEFLSVICEYAQENGLGDLTGSGSARGVAGRTNDRAGTQRTPTYKETRLLLEQGRSIRQAAHERGLSANTIVAHIEALVRSGELIDLRPHLPAEDRVGDIESAFEEVGYARLAPVKALLGDDFSYEEIRLVRAFVLQQLGAREAGC